MSQHHQRRRLLLAEETASATVSADGADTSAKHTAPHPANKSHSRPRKLGALLPSRPITMLVRSVALGSMVALVLYLHALAESATGLSDRARQVLDLHAQGNVGQWFASMLLGFESLVALSVYALRKRRIDDYNGRYRGWLWVAAACLLGSVFEGTDLGALALWGAGRAAAAWQMNVSLLWPGALFAVNCLVGMRLIVEVRRSRTTLAMLGCCGIAMALGVAFERGWLTLTASDALPLVVRGFWLSGYAAILVSFWVYGLHVGRELESAQAAPKRKRVKQKTTARPSGETSDETSVEEVRRAESPRPVSAAQPRLHAGSGSSQSSATEATNAGLSRAERRKMRREARRAA